MTKVCEVEDCSKLADVRCNGHLFCMYHYEKYFYEQQGMPTFEFVHQDKGTKIELPMPEL